MSGMSYHAPPGDAQHRLSKNELRFDVTLPMSAEAFAKIRMAPTFMEAVGAMLHHDVAPEPIKMERDPVDGRLLAETVRQYPQFQAPAWLLKTMEGPNGEPLSVDMRYEYIYTDPETPFSWNIQWTPSYQPQNATIHGTGKLLPDISGKKCRQAQWDPQNVGNVVQNITAKALINNMLIKSFKTFHDALPAIVQEWKKSHHGSD